MKKKRMVGILIAGLILMTFGGVAFGTEATAEIFYKAADSSFVIGGKGHGSVSILILPEGITPQSFNTDTQAAYFDILSSDEDETYLSKKFYLVNDVLNGRYTAYITDSLGQEDSVSFIYIETPLPQDALDRINVAKNAEEITKVMEAAPMIYGIDMEDEVYKSYSKLAYSIFCALQKTYTAETSGEICDDFYAALAMAQLGNSGETEVQKILKKYSVKLGFSSPLGYEDKRLNADTQKELCRLLINTDYQALLKENADSGNTFDFVKWYEKQKVLSVVRKVRNWQELRDALTEKFKEECPFILQNSKYALLDDKDAVFIAMAKENYNKFEDIESTFTKVLENAGSNDREIKQGSGGGGGTRISLPASENNEPLPTDQIVFSDLPENHWCFEAINRLYEKNIVSGYADGCFHPDTSITRAEFVKLLVTGFGIDATDTKHFLDVALESWYAKYISAAAGCGIALGNPDGFFNPDANVTRQDAAVMLWRTLKHVDAIKTEGKDVTYSDETSIAEYSRFAIATLSELGVLKGDDESRFRPLEECKRSESAKMIYESMRLY